MAPVTAVPVAPSLEDDPPKHDQAAKEDSVTYSFSHAMCLVPTAAAGRRAYENLGFTTHEGGRHTVGTENFLVPLEQGYLELISIYDETSARRSPRRRAIVEYIQREAGGLIGFALRTSTIASDVERLTDAGLAYGGPIAAERTTPDGVVLRWQVLRPTPQPCPALMPILVTGDVPTPPFTGNPNTVVAAEGISIVGEDAPRLVEDYRVLLDADPVDVKERPDLGGSASVFHVDRFVIEIIEPARDGVASRALARQGPGPVELRLRASDPAVVAEVTGLDVSQGALVIPPVVGCGVRLLVIGG